MYLVLLNRVCFLSLGFCLCSVYDGCYAFCLICDACSLRYSLSNSIFVWSCRCCVFVSCCSSMGCVLCSFKFVNVCGGYKRCPY